MRQVDAEELPRLQRVEGIVWRFVDAGGGLSRTLGCDPRRRPDDLVAGPRTSSIVPAAPWLARWPWNADFKPVLGQPRYV